MLACRSRFYTLAFTILPFFIAFTHALALISRDAGGISTTQTKNLSSFQHFPVPNSNPPISLIVENVVPLHLQRPNTIFGALMNQLAALSTHDQDQILPAGFPATTYDDCVLTISNPAVAEEMKFAVAVEAVRGVGEWLLAHGSENGGLFRISVDDYVVGIIWLRGSAGSGGQVSTVS